MKERNKKKKARVWTLTSKYSFHIFIFTSFFLLWSFAWLRLIKFGTFTHGLRAKGCALDIFFAYYVWINSIIWSKFQSFQQWLCSIWPPILNDHGVLPILIHKKHIQVYNSREFNPLFSRLSKFSLFFRRLSTFNWVL